MPDRNFYFTTKEASLYLKVSPATLEKWRIRGGGPRFRKLGSRVTYSLNDLEAWVEKGARISTSDPGPQAA